jgi:hypothetical protein
MELDVFRGPSSLRGDSPRKGDRIMGIINSTYPRLRPKFGCKSEEEGAIPAANLEYRRGRSWWKIFLGPFNDLLYAFFAEPDLIVSRSPEEEVGEDEPDLALVAYIFVVFKLGAVN